MDFWRILYSLPIKGFVRQLEIMEDNPIKINTKYKTLNRIGIALSGGGARGAAHVFRLNLDSNTNFIVLNL